MSVSIDSRSFLHDLRLVRARLAEFIAYEGMIDARELSWCYSLLTEMVEAIEDAEVLLASIRTAIRTAQEDGVGPQD